MLNRKTCRNCKIKFQPAKDSQKFCCPKCRSEYTKSSAIEKWAKIKSTNQRQRKGFREYEIKHMG